MCRLFRSHCSSIWGLFFSNFYVHCVDLSSRSGSSLWRLVWIVIFLLFFPSPSRPSPPRFPAANPSGGSACRRGRPAVVGVAYRGSSDLRQYSPLIHPSFFLGAVVHPLTGLDFDWSQLQRYALPCCRRQWQVQVVIPSPSWPPWSETPLLIRSRVL